MSAPTLSLSYESTLLPAATVLALTGIQSISKDGFVNFPPSSLTFSLWLKTDSTDTAAVILAYDADGQDTSHQILLGNPANLTLLVGTGTTGPTGVAINDGVWHQIALTLEPYATAHTAVTLYVDGAVRFVAVGAVAQTAFESAGTLVLGRKAVAAAGAAGSLVGAYSEFRLWNGARTAAQINTDMQVRADALTPAPLEYWMLDQKPADATLNGNPAFVSSELRLRTQTFTASWDAVANATSYNLYVQEVGGCWQPMITGVAASPQAITTYAVSAASKGMVQAVVDATPGPWSAEVQATLLNLPPLSPALNPDLTNATLSVDWTAVDQAPKTQYATYQDGTGTPTIVTTQAFTEDLTTLMKDAAHWWAYTLRADSDAGSLGPLTDVETLAAPDLTFHFQNDATSAGTLELSWPTVTGASNLYLDVEQTSGTPSRLADALLAGTATSKSLSPTLTENQALSATVRGLTLGTIGQWSPAQTVTIHRFPPPHIVSAVGDGDAHTVSVGWQIDTQTTGLTFELDLYDSTGQTPIVPQVEASASPYVFTNAQIIDGTSFKVRIRASKTGSYSLWSAWQDVSVASLPAVPLSPPTVNAKNDITVAWARPSDMPDDASYVVSINSPTPQSATLSASTTTTTFDHGDTKVAPKTTYTVSMHAKKNADLGPVTTVDVETVATGDNPGHNPNSDDKDDPINTSDGSYSYSQKLLTLVNPVPIEFGVYYATTYPTHAENAQINDLPLGPRWTHVYTTRIVRNDGEQKAVVLWGEGQIDQYAMPASVIGPYTKLGLQNGDSLAYFNDQKFRLVRANQTVFTFDASGKLEAIAGPGSNSLTLTYDGSDRLQTVSDGNTNKSLTFAYTSANLLQSVTDNAARVVSFGYSATKLETITNAGGGTRHFTYTGDSLVETAIDESGNTLVKNTFQTQVNSPRVTFQQDGRAIADGKSYGSSFDFSEVSENGVDFIVCAYTDREGNAHTYKSIKANGSTVEDSAILPNNAVMKIVSSYDGNTNLLTRQVYRGPTADYAPGKGSLWQFTYDGDNNLLTDTDPLSQTTTRTYDDKNRVSSLTDALGNQMVYHYDGELLAWYSDFLGQKASLTYQSGAIKGLVKSVTDRDGNVFSFTYDANGQIQIATDPFGNVTLFTYFPTGLQQQVTSKDAGGNALLTRTYDYWGDGSRKSVKLQYTGQSAADAFVTAFDYNPDGRIHTSTDPENNVVTYGYDANAFVNSVNYPDANGVSRVTSFAFDRDDHPESRTDSANLGITSGFDFDQFGQLNALTDPEGQIYAYDYGSVRVSDTNYSSSIIETLPLLAGQQTAAHTQKWTFDAAERLTETVDAQNQSTSVAYSTVQDPTTQRHHRVVTITLPPADAQAGATTRVFEYDPLNRLVRSTDEAGKSTRFIYAVQQNPNDSLFYQMVTRTDAANRVTTIMLDPLGRTSSVTIGTGVDALTRVFEHDVLNRPTQVSETTPTGNTIITTFAYSFDTTEKAVKVVIARQGQATALATRYLDGLGRMVKEVDADGAVRSFSYSPWGPVEQMVEPSSKTFQYHYDDAGRFKSTVLPDTSTIDRTLDKNGNALTVTSTAGQTITRTYDHWNRLLSRTDEAGQSVGYAYLPTSALETLTYSDQKTATYTYDGLGRMHTITDWASRQTTYAYDPVGRVTSIAAPNGTATALGYDDAGSLLSVANTSGANIISQTVYTLNAAGTRSTAEMIASLAPSITAGQSTLAYNLNNQATSFNGDTLGRTPDGSLTTLPHEGATATVAYDDCNRVHTVDADTYTYDLEGHRTQTVLSGTTRKYLIDAGSYRDPRINYPDFQHLNETGQFIDSQGAPSLLPSDGSALPSYSHLVTQPLDRSLEIRDANDAITHRMVYGLGLLGMETAGSGYQVFHFDSRGSTTALSDEQGRVTDRYDYDIYGALNSHSGSSFNPFLYNGRDGVIDDGNGLLYMRSRHFAPSLFNFLQRDLVFGDPFTPQSLDRYAFVRNDPMALVDPLGFSGSRDVWKWVLGGAGIVGGLAALGGAAAYFGPSFAAGYGIGLGGGFPNLARLGRVGGWGARLGRWVGGAGEVGGALDPLLGGGIEMGNMAGAAGGGAVGGGAAAAGGGGAAAGGAGLGAAAGGAGLGVSGSAVIGTGVLTVGAVIAGGIVVANLSSGMRQRPGRSTGGDGASSSMGVTGSLQASGSEALYSMPTNQVSGSIPQQQQIPFTPSPNNAGTLRYRGRSAVGGSSDDSS